MGRPDPKILSTVAAFCENCRCHLDLSIQFPSANAAPCPTEDSPLHHFRYQPRLSQPRRTADDPAVANAASDWKDIRCFQCSTIDCSANLKIQISPPRLRPQWVELLINKDLIKSRAEKVISEDPERFEGHGIPRPSEILTNLGAYVVNALRKPDRRPIAAHNKKFLLGFSEPCAEMFEYLGFVRGVSQEVFIREYHPDQDALQEDTWEPPQPDFSAAPPVSNPINRLLEDVEKELQALLLQRPDDEKRASKVQYGLTSATRDLGKVLGTSDCEKPTYSSMIIADDCEDKKNLTARSKNSNGPEHPFFPTLGAYWDFHDDLVQFAYERQIVADPEHTPYYLEALQGLARGRESEALQTFVVMEESSGKVSAEDVRNAYKALGLGLETEFLDEDHIIGTFQSRAADSPRQEPELRRALQIIGHDQSSQKIQFVADKTIENYEQALSWLGVKADTDDEFIVAVYKVKEEENSADQNTSRHAITLIAQHRKSRALQQWLATGVLGQVEMNVTQAYNRFGIDDRTIEDQLVLSAFELLYQEAPSQVDDLRSALRAIADDRESKFLSNFLDSGMTTAQYPLGEWPVGLANIGNTCYLNSLLQFYFTMKPLRDLVLNFDDYKLDLETASSVKRTVGSRNVSRQEVQRAQQFVYGLQNLFEHMIASPQAHVKPELELARLTLLSQPVEAVLRRRSTVGGSRPSLGEINGKAVLGPLPPPIAEILPSDVNGIEKTIESNVNGVHGNKEADSSSEVTLLGNDVAETRADQEMLDSPLMMSVGRRQQQQQEIFEDKENLPPIKIHTERPPTPDRGLKPLAESSPSRTNEQPMPTQASHEPDDESDLKILQEVTVAPPPTRPPPFPPRPQTEEQKQAVMEEVQIGAQQDVTEVIANVLFQLECAIKATSFDPSSEQIDLIKTMFFGRQKSYTPDLTGGVRTNEQFFSSLIVDVASGPKDIYEALDGAFDVQEVEVEGSLRPQYTTISRLPPVLKIHIQRVQYDRQKGSAFKSINHLELKETIYMDRYMDSDDNDLLQRRKESWEWKDELRQLEARKLELTETELNMSLPELLKTTEECLGQLAEDEDLGISPEFIAEIAKAAAATRQELTAVNQRIKDVTSFISSQFADDGFRRLAYRLQSVFIHIGSASYGHYWIYVRDFKRNLWRKYNDESVSAVTDISTIFDLEPGDRPPTPYFLVYVKDDQKDELVDPVCRDINEQLRLEVPDSVMEDAVGENIVMYDNATMEPAANGQGSYPERPYGGWFGTDTVKTQEW
ncbi:MAG: hypothetical protein Q9203_000685 [Teloschistes exilis]